MSTTNRQGDRRRTALLDAMADHLLRYGLAGSALRALAAAAGTSDRMLLYYFADKNELMTVLLAHVGERLAAALAADDGAAAEPYPALLARLWVAARSPALRPYMLLFLDVAAAAGRGEEPHRTAAAGLARDFITWVGRRLDAPEEERPARAARLLATVDGLFLLECAGCAAEAMAAAAAG